MHLYFAYYYNPAWFPSLEKSWKGIVGDVFTLFTRSISPPFTHVELALPYDAKKIKGQTCFRTVTITFSTRTVKVMHKSYTPEVARFYYWQKVRIDRARAARLDELLRDVEMRKPTISKQLMFQTGCCPCKPADTGENYFCSQLIYCLLQEIDILPRRNPAVLPSQLYWIVRTEAYWEIGDAKLLGKGFVPEEWPTHGNADELVDREKFAVPRGITI